MLKDIESALVGRFRDLDMRCPATKSLVGINRNRDGTRREIGKIWRDNTSDIIQSS